MTRKTRKKIYNANVLLEQMEDILLRNRSSYPSFSSNEVYRGNYLAGRKSEGRCRESCTLQPSPYLRGIVIPAISRIVLDPRHVTNQLTFRLVTLSKGGRGEASWRRGLETPRARTTHPPATRITRFEDSNCGAVGGKNDAPTEGERG